MSGHRNLTFYNMYCSCICGITECTLCANQDSTIVRRQEIAMTISRDAVLLPPRELYSLNLIIFGALNI